MANAIFSLFPSLLIISIFVQGGKENLFALERLSQTLAKSPAAAQVQLQQLELRQPPRLGDAPQPVHVSELRAPAEVQRQRLQRGEPAEALQPVHVRELLAAVEVQRQRLERAEPRDALQTVLVRELLAALEV